MPEPSIHSILYKSFPKSGKDEWLRIASQELGPQKQSENLIWKIDGLDFYPYYDEKDLNNLSYLKKFEGPHQQAPPVLWENIPQIKVSTEREANERALEYLRGGADGVLFDVTNCIGFNINELLDQITWPYCSVSFLARETNIATKILDYAGQNKYEPSQLRGSVFGNTLPENTPTRRSAISSLANYRFFGLSIPPSSPVQEISKSLEHGVRRINTLSGLEMDKGMVLKNICFSFTASENFLVNVAKLKTFRMLWYQVSQAFEVPNYFPEDLYLHVVSQPVRSDNFEPRGNMIKSTTDALSAVLGGCSALTLSTDEKDDEMGSRTALNVSNILKEESHLDKVSYAVAGAYTIEKIVHELAQASWKEFQKNIRP